MNLTPFETYLKEISATPLLTREEEILFAQRIQQNLKQYRHSILSTAYLLQAAVDLLENVRSGKALPHNVIEMSPAGAAEKQRLQRLLGRRLSRVDNSGAAESPGVRLGGRPEQLDGGRVRCLEASARCAARRRRGSCNNCRRSWRCCSRRFRNFKALPGRWKRSGDNWIGREKPAAATDAKSLRAQLWSLMQCVQEDASTLTEQLALMAKCRQAYEAARQEFCVRELAAGGVRRQEASPLRPEHPRSDPGGEHGLAAGGR